MIGLGLKFYMVLISRSFTVPWGMSCSPLRMDLSNILGSMSLGMADT